MFEGKKEMLRMLQDLSSILLSKDNMFQQTLFIGTKQQILMHKNTSDRSKTKMYSVNTGMFCGGCVATNNRWSRNKVNRVSGLTIDVLR